MKITVTQNVEVPDMTASPAEVGSWMVTEALSQWYQYNDNDTFTHQRDKDNDTWFVFDPDENKHVTFTSAEFFRQHATLIWLGTIENYRHDWIDFAFKSHGATPDEYDANTCDAVLQNMLYGSIVYG